jgi:multiphosphoryl transfer protein
MSELRTGLESFPKHFLNKIAEGHMDDARLAPQVMLKAPLSGRLVPLERVPDPVFSQKLAGDGVALDPTSESLLAPCDGTVVMVHPANHAVTLRTVDGLELLMHIGLETIHLKGRGFTPRVKSGDQVAAGTPLIEFDADFVATHAKSLLSMLVVTNPERIATFERASGNVTAGSDVILRLAVTAERAPSEAEAGAPITSPGLLIVNSAGLHARPAAVLANVARKFDADVWLQRGDARANAKSISGILRLDVRHGEKVNVVARGSDAQRAVQALAPLIESGLGEEGVPAPAPAARVVAEISRPPQVPRSTDPDVLLGVTASPGLAIGAVFQVRRQDVDVPESAEDPDAEELRLAQALDAARQQLEVLQVSLHGRADADKAAIFAAHQEVLDDPELHDAVRSAIRKGKSAAYAWQRVIRAEADELAAMNNPLLAARAADLRDVGQRVLHLITGEAPRPIELPAQGILVAEDLTPSETAGLDRARVLGFCTTLGSATSHVAIIARSLDIPAVVGMEPRALQIPEGTQVILDGTRGAMRLRPSEEEVSRIQARQRKLAVRKKRDLENAVRPAVTIDSHRVEVAANIGNLADAREAMSAGGEGVGLLRTEFLFLDRDTAPSEDEQLATYGDIARALGPNRALVIRTLDVGGDKPLRYLPITKEENPFLGERGVRVGLNRPEVLRTQLRAVLRASPAGKLLVMFPMVATTAEWRAARTMLEEERRALDVPPIPVGIMIEVPAAAILAEQFARDAEFFSIGTNDLTQYTLAMDRNNPKLATQVDALEPSVLHLIAQTVAGARAHDRPVSVCGGVASDPQAVPLLIGLGVSKLSVTGPAIPGIKAQIRELRLTECQALAQDALTRSSAAEVRALVLERCGRTDESPEPEPSRSAHDDDLASDAARNRSS